MVCVLDIANVKIILVHCPYWVIVAHCPYWVIPGHWTRLMWDEHDLQNLVNPLTYTTEWQMAPTLYVCMTFDTTAKYGPTNR